MRPCFAHQGGGTTLVRYQWPTLRERPSRGNNLGLHKPWYQIDILVSIEVDRSFNAQQFQNGHGIYRQGLML